MSKRKTINEIRDEERNKTLDAVEKRIRELSFVADDFSSNVIEIVMNDCIRCVRAEKVPTVQTG